MKKCPITQKRTQVGGAYSNRTRATKFNPVGKVRRSPNMITKKVYVPELQKSVRVSLSTSGLKTLEKNGAYKTLKKANLI
ncbi:MAG TPA: bL28 family ribosomal protein [Candidatus Paceibacterota bacterium]|nr:bL28 family ribosomal protein [Candidatus Paceibacterota bacterium]